MIMGAELKLSNQVIIMVLLIFSILISSCAPPAPQISADERIEDLGIDKDEYDLLPLCQKIEIFADVAKYHVDFEHMGSAVPGWMLISIRNHSEESIAECISMNGTAILKRLLENPGNSRLDSYAIHALVYEAYELKLLDYPSIDDFVRQTICSGHVQESFLIEPIYYIHQFGYEAFESMGGIVS